VIQWLVVSSSAISNKKLLIYLFPFLIQVNRISNQNSDILLTGFWN
jgi:hypothetical protein